MILMMTRVAESDDEQHFSPMVLCYKPQRTIIRAFLCSLKNYTVSQWYDSVQLGGQWTKFGQFSDITGMKKDISNPSDSYRNEKKTLEFFFGSKRLNLIFVHILSVATFSTNTFQKPSKMKV